MWHLYLVQKLYISAPKHGSRDDSDLNFWNIFQEQDECVMGWQFDSCLGKSISQNLIESPRTMEAITFRNYDRIVQGLGKTMKELCHLLKPSQQ
jgi:hypothetical protein